MPYGKTTYQAHWRKEAAERYLKGESQYEIAEALGVSQKTVSAALQNVQQEWMDRAIRSFDAARAREIAKVDQLEREYWDAWQGSLKPRQVVKVNKSKGKDTSFASLEDMHGNPAYLDGVLRCIERRCKLLGLDAPDRSMHLTIPWESLSEEQLKLLRAGKDPREVLSFRGPTSDPIDVTPGAEHAATDPDPTGSAG